jgi:hypothetical protein
MEELIRMAFSHVDVLASYVAAGQYDLIGPNGEIILPEVWETIIEPDWYITMHMWSMPEPPSGSPDGATVTSTQKERPEQPISLAALTDIFDVPPLKLPKKKSKDNKTFTALFGSTNSSGRHKSSGRSKK